MALRRSTRIVLAIFAVVVALLGWAGWYVQDKGFTHNWRELVHAEFKQRGIHATIRRLTLDPVQGLVARDLRLYEDEDHRILLMSISKVSLDLDLANLNQGQLALRSFDVLNGRLSIPLDERNRHKGEQLVIDRLNARVLMPEDRIEIVRGSARLGEITLNLKGSLFRPVSDPTEEEEPKGEEGPDFGESQIAYLSMIRDNREQIESILQPLREIAFSAQGRPVIDVQVQGDMEKPESIRAKGTLTCGAAVWREFAMEALSGRFEYQDGILTLDDILLRDEYGKLISRLELATRTGELAFSIDSGIDVPGLLQAATQNPALKEAVFYQPPLFQLEGTIFLREESDLTQGVLPIEALGTVRMDTVASRGVILDGISFDVSLDRENLYLRNGRIDHKSGFLTFGALKDESGFRYRADMRMDPTVFAPFMAFEGTRQFLSCWEFDQDSSIYVSIEGTGPSMDSRTWTSFGEVDLRNCRLNQCPIDHLSARMELIAEMHHFYDVTISRAEGGLTGEHIELNHADLTCRLHGVQGMAQPTHVVGWFAPHAVNELQPYEFAEPPLFTLSGLMDCRPVEWLTENPRHDYTIAFQSDAAAAYELFGERLEVNRPSGIVRVKGDSVRIESFEAEALGGFIGMELAFEDTYTEPVWDAELQITDVEFRQLAELYSFQSDTEGRFSASFIGNGRVHEADTMRAKGKALISDGNVFSIPLFGPLSRPVATNLPRLSRDLSIAHEATVEYRIEGSTFYTDKLLAETRAFRVIGDGEVDLETSEVDLEVVINFRGAPGLVLNPVSQLLSFQSEGSLTDPVWRPKAIPSGLDSTLEGMQKVTGGALREAGDVTEGAFRGAGEMTEGALKGAGEMTEGALRGAGNMTGGALREAGRSIRVLPFNRRKKEEAADATPAAPPESAVESPEAPQ